MEYYKASEVAKLLGYTDDAYIRRLILSHKINAKKKDGKWLVSREEIEKFRIKSKINSKFKTLLGFNQELRLFVEKTIQDKIPNEIGPKDGLSSFVLSKGFKTHGSIMLLCENGFGEDASVLVRSLFELMVTLLYVLDDPSEKRAYRYYGYDWILRERMLGHFKDNPEIMRQIEARQAEPKYRDNSIEEIKRMAKKVQDKYKYHKGYGSWSDKNLFDMAKEVGRENTYQTIYRLSSQQIHSQPRTINDYASNTPEGLLFSMAQSENWVEENLVAMFDFFLTIIGKVSEQFGWSIKESLDQLTKRYLMAVKSLNKEVKDLKK